MDISYFPACFALKACDCDLTVGPGRASLSGHCAAERCRSDAGGTNNLNSDPLSAAKAASEEKNSDSGHTFMGCSLSLLTNDATSGR